MVRRSVLLLTAGLVLALGCRGEDPIDIAPGELAFQQSNLSFGALSLGDESSLVALIKNQGASTTEVTSVSVEGPFRVENIDSLPGTRLLPSEELQIRVFFEPTQPGNHTGTLNVAYGEQDTTISLLLEGLAEQGPLPAIEFEPPELAFGDISVGDSFRRTVIVRNNGEASANFTGFDMAQGGGSFDVQATMPMNIRAGSFSNVAITFVPTANGAVEDSLVFQVDELADPVSLRVFGNGAR